MGQLINITSKAFEAVRIHVGGKNVPEEQIQAERRRALHRGTILAKQARVESEGFTNEVNHYYNRLRAVSGRAPEIRQTAPEIQLSGPPSTAPSTADVVSKQAQSHGEFVLTLPMGSKSSGESLRQENMSNYYRELGATEMKVQRGELSFVPPMNMTIVTQYPEVKIEYTGDFNYFPTPVELGENINTES